MTGSNRKVLIGPSTFAVTDAAPLDRLRSAGLDIVPNPYGRKLSKEELAQLLPGVVAVVAGLEHFSCDILERSQLKVISRCGAGLSNVDLEAAGRLGIRVMFTPDAPTEAVAELTVGAMITLLRHLPRMDRDLHKGIWQKHIGLQIAGKTVAIVGFGRIGRKVARLLSVFNVRLLAVDPRLAGSVEGVLMVPMLEALSVADVVTIHASGDDEIIGESQFSRLKRGAFLLNAARGNLINEAALCRALDSGVVGGAWIDVFADEPYSGPLLRYDQVLLSPHIGSASAECRKQMEMEAVENLIAALDEDAQE